MWQLPIPRATLELLYTGLDVDLDLFEREASDDEEFIQRFLVSKLWRLNNLFTIVDKQGKRVQFVMNYAQHEVYAASIRHARIIVLKSRQQGISTFWLISFYDDALINSDQTIGLMSQGLSESSTLLKRVKLAIDTFPQEILSFLGVSLFRDNSSELGFTNGSTVFIRTSFRSATLQRLHVSELAKIANKSPDKAREVLTGTLQAVAPGNVVVIESTAEGDNAFKVLWLQAVSNELRGSFAPKDFKPVFLPWFRDPDCVSSFEEQPSQAEERYFTDLMEEVDVVLAQEQKNFYVAQLRELGDAIYQEYPSTPDEAFKKVLSGAYYGVLYATFIVKKKRLVKNLWDPNLKVHVALDLGMNDTFVMVYFQVWGTEWRIVDEYSNSGEGLEHYVTKMSESEYNIGDVIAPHDIEVRELGTGKSRKLRLIELGVSSIVVLPRTSIEAGIEQVRVKLKNLWVDERCTEVQAAFVNYSKDWDEKHEVWMNRPLHDKFSHAADAIRTMAMSNVRAKRQVGGKALPPPGSFAL